MRITIVYYRAKNRIFRCAFSGKRAEHSGGYEMIKVVIDGKSYSAKKGERLIDIILRNKIDVPHLCYEEGLSTTGSCGLCLVEIKGKGVLKACEQEVYEGMEVITESEQLEEERKKAFLFLLTYTSHPTECLFCDRYSECSGADNCLKGLDIKKGCKLCPKDGDCVIQRLTERFGLLGSNIEIKKVREKRYREINEPFFIRDYNYCLLCSKCIRVCYERRLQNSCIAYVEQEGPFYRKSMCFLRIMYRYLSFRCVSK